MKIKERAFTDDGKLIIQQTHDATATLHRARMLRDSGHRLMSDSWCIGVIPGALLAAWAKEAGVLWSDTEAMEEIVNRKLQSGEFNKFRVDEGTY